MRRSNPATKWSNRSATSEERFWNMVQKGADGECWIWTGCTVRRYGAFQLDGKIIRAHRYSYQLHFGRIPCGACVCHHCDNPLCVNPSHLFTGTHKDNADDRERKNRSNPCFGESNGSSKITAEIALRIREVRKNQGLSYKKLGVMFGVCTMHAYDIVNFKYWKHV